MRNEAAILKQIQAWASGNAHIRTVVWTGSRVAPAGAVDLLSDYDIELGVSDRSLFLHNDQWLFTFGEIAAQVREDTADYSMRLVLYTDYVRIDFKVYEVGYLKQYTTAPPLPVHWEAGYQILVDKDGILKGLALPAYTAFRIEKPTESAYMAVVNDFWWDTTYVAKSLWRKELFYAKYMLDSVIRFAYLQPMIEWSIGLQHGWSVTTNKNGRFFKRYLDAPAWCRLEKTYAGSSLEENWKALFAMVPLFRDLAVAIATALEYTYPYATDKAICRFLEKIKSLDEGTIDSTEF